MVKLNDKELDRLARLAKLELSKEERVRFGSQLDCILGYIEVLDEVQSILEKSNIPTELVSSAFGEGIPRESQPSAKNNLERSSVYYKDGLVEIPPVFKR